VNELNSLNPQDTERLQTYRGLLDFYLGRQWPGREKWGEKRLTFNYAAIFIDKLTSYLMNGRNFTVEAIQDSPQEQARAQAAEKALEQVHEYNHLEQLDFETEIDCAILGDACYKVTWEEGGVSSFKFPDSSPGNGRVRVTAPDIQGISAWWAGDDLSRVWKVASRYSLTTEEVERLYPDLRFKINDSSFKRENPSQSPFDKGRGSQTVLEVWTDSDFELYLDNNLIEKKSNPYGFIPFVIFPNLRTPKQFWGTSDLASIMQPQRELNRAMSQISHILELSGNPVTVLENVDESTDIVVKPGAVWNIPEDAKAYLLDLLKDGGLNLHINYIELLYRTMHDIAETPRAAFGGTGKDLSGIAMQIELYPLIQKVMRKRTIRNSVYNRRNEMILKLLQQFQVSSSEFQVPSPSPKTSNYDLSQLRLRTVWGQVLPADQAKLIENEKTLVEKGIHSRRRAMDEVGVKDPEAEFKHWVEEEERIRGIDQKLKIKEQN
jgi:hypothetical protein